MESMVRTLMSLPERRQMNETIKIQTVLEIIHRTGGCDASDEYSKGWDDACNEIYEQIRELETVVPDINVGSTIPKEHKEHIMNRFMRRN